MDISDERRKKLEAGKEKLAAFRKKKAKVKKGAHDDNPEVLNVKDQSEPNSDDVTATCVLGGPQAFQAEQVEPSPKNETKFPSPESEILVKNVSDQTAHSQGWPQMERKHVSIEENAKSQDTESSDLEQALSQRDRLIQDLTASLKANAGQQAEKEDLASQVLGLAQHVSQLQTQLQEADQSLQEQLRFHGISSSALESAKTQMLQLQSIVHAKDEELVYATQQLEKNADCLRQSKEENVKLSQSIGEKDELLKSLQLSLDASVLSHEEKQEKEELEKSQRIPELQNQWREKEGKMSKHIESQAKEIEEWKRCELEWKERESQLKNDFDAIVNRLQQADSKGERLQALEEELEQLRKQNDASQDEVVSLRMENQEEKNSHKSSLSQLELLTEEHKKLATTHSNLASELEDLKAAKSKLEESCRQFKEENDNMSSNLQELSDKLMEEQKKVEAVNVHHADVEAKHRLDCDKLNNKINQLQSSLSQTQESLSQTETALEEEREAVEALKHDIAAKESSLLMLSQEISDLSNSNANFQTQLYAKENSIKVLEGLLSEKSNEEERFKNKEVDLNEDKRQLEKSVATLTKEMNELRNQCDKYAQQIVQQQDENISANHIETVQVSEKECADLKIVDQIVLVDGMSNFTDENLNNEKEKCKTLEAEIQIVEDQRKELHENIEKLNDEIFALKEDLETEKARSNILKDEMMSMSDELVGAHNSVQRHVLEKRDSEREHKTALEEYKSDNVKLNTCVEEYTKDSEQLNLKLKESEESLKLQSSELKSLKTDVEEMREREKQLLEDQEQMQGQLESTINQWQKLQLIVQEKEIESQNLQEDLDEQKRICSTLRKNHEEELEAVNTSITSLENAKKSNEAHIQELEGKLVDLQGCLEAKEMQFSDTVDKLQSSDSSFQTLTKDLMDKNAELYSVSSEKDKISTELSEKLKDIASLTEDLEKTKKEMVGLNEDLKTQRNHLEALENTLTVEKKERESDLEHLNSISSEKDKISAELSDKLKDIANLMEDLDKAKNEITCLREDLKTKSDDHDSLENAFSAEKKEKESVQEELEKTTEELSIKEQDLTLQLEGLKSQMEEVQYQCVQLSTENGQLKTTFTNLESSNLERDRLLSDEQISRQKLESMLVKECKNNKRLQARVSSLLQDIEGKDGALFVNGAVLEERTAELAEKDSKLAKSLEDLKLAQEGLVDARNEIVSTQQSLKESRDGNESLLAELKRKEMELGEMAVNQGVLEGNEETMKHSAAKLEADLAEQKAEMNDINGKVCRQERELKDLNERVHKQEGEIDNLNRTVSQQKAEREDLHMKVTHLESLCDDKGKLLSTEQSRTEQLMAQVGKEQQQCKRLEGLLSALSTDSEDQGKSLVELSSALEEKMSHISQLERDLNEKKDILLESDSLRLELEARVEDLTVKEQSLLSEVTELKSLVDKHEQEMSGLTQINKEMYEKLNLVEEEIKRQEVEILDLKQDNDIISKDCSDLKVELQDKDSKNVALLNEVELMKNALQMSNEEKEMLKNNFDACLEEVQQKSSDQEAELNRYKGQMTEELKNQHQSQDEMKEICSQQLSHMEDKLMAVERERAAKEKEVEEGHSKLEALRDEYEQQVSELELSVQSAQSEAMKLNDMIYKINEDHESELRDLKNLHEIQTSELMDNCLSLEKSMSELQKTMNDQANNMKQERNEMEQSFENLMSEMDERKRRSDSDVSRLKNQQEEMRKDHENELKALEKKYERQLFDLEDRCSVLTSEMERRRKSMAGVEGDFAEERQSLEDKIENLESVRRDLEIKCSILEDDLTLLKEQSSSREGEMKSILKAAAEKESENKSEILELKEKLSSSKKSSKTSEESIKRELEHKLQDLREENKHLNNRLKTLEQNAELYSDTKPKDVEAIKSKDSTSKAKEMQKQVAALTEENLLLKRRLLGQKSLEKKIRLQSGVEDICPPLNAAATQDDAIHPVHIAPITSTPSKSKREPRMREPRTPTGEEVSLIEGFISETSQKPLAATALQREKLLATKSGDEEPDFVFEESDWFQPEQEIEQAVGDFDQHQMKSNIHPIVEDEVIEGFQPEISDQFFVEMSEHSSSNWPINLSVGMSPTSKASQQFVFDKKEKESQPVCEEGFAPETSAQTFADSIPDRGDKSGQIMDSEEMKKHLKQMREDLEEEYMFKSRKQEQNIILEYEAKQETIQKEMDFHFAQKEQSIRNDWEKKFARALQKMKKDFEKKSRKQDGQMALVSKSKKRQNSGGAEVAKGKDSQEDDGMPDIEEGSEELGEVLEQLSKDNQELAEVRDLLLKQIEMSQAKGLHHRKQYELQSMLTSREKDSVPSADISSSPTKEATAIAEEVCQTSKAVQLCATSPNSADTDEDPNRTEHSETSSVAAERFLEELEDMSQPSCQDLPLEWELTSTIVEDAIVPGNSTGHQSIWEVFDSRCVRQDCQEVRHRYRKLCKCVVKSFGLGEDLVLEESGLFPGEGGGVTGEGGGVTGEGGGAVGENQGIAVGLTPALIKGEMNIDELGEEEMDELFADNVALESQLLSLAENMVVYKKAFVKEKQDLERENEFLRSELEASSVSRVDLEKQLIKEKEDMMNHSMKESCLDKEVMTNVSSEGLEEDKKRSLEAKQEIINGLKQDIECLKSGFEEMFCQYKENAECRLNALVDEVEDLKTEKRYLCLTHEGKEETIAKSIIQVEQLKSTISDHENNLSTMECKIQDLKEQVTSLEKKNKDLLSDLIEKTEDMTNLKILKEEQMESFSSKSKEMELLQRKNSDLTDETVHLLSTLEEKEKVIKSLTSELELLKLTNNDLEQRLSTKEVQVKELEAKVADLEEQGIHLQTSLAEKTDQVDNLNGEVSKVVSEKKLEKRNSVDKDSKLETLEAEMKNIRERNAEMESVISTREEEIASLKAVLADVKTQEEVLVCSSTEKEAKIKDLETVVVHLEESKQELLSCLEGKDETAASLESELLKVKDLEEKLLAKDAQIDILESQSVDAEDELSSLQAVSQKSISAIRSLEQKISQLQSHLADMSQKTDTLLQQSEKKDASIASLQSELNETLKQLQGSQAEKEDLISVCNKKEHFILQLKSEVRDAEHQIQEMLHNLSDKSILEELNGKVSDLKAEREGLQTALEFKDVCITEKEQESDNLKSQLQDVSMKLENLQEVKKNVKVLEDQNSALCDKNQNLRSVLDVEEQHHAQSKLEVSDLKSKMEDMSARLEQLDRENDRLRNLEDDIEAMKDQNKTLKMDLEEKTAVTTNMEQEIDELRNKMSQMSAVDKQEAVVDELILVREIKGTESCSIVRSESSDVYDDTDRNSSPQTSFALLDPTSKTPGYGSDQLGLDNVKEDGIVEEKMYACENSVQMHGMSSSESIRVGASPDAVREGEEGRQLSGSIYFDTSSTNPQDQSFMSSTTSLILGAEFQDPTLADELNKLKKDLRETKAIYSRENSLLREALDQEKRVKSRSGSSEETAPNASAPSDEEGRSENPEDETSIEQRLAVCLEQNKMLEEENNKFRTKIRKQEAVVLIYKHRLSEKEHDSEMWRKSLTSQLQALQKQRDDLVQLLRQQELGSSPSISEAIGQAAIKEESLRKVQDNLMEKMEELDHLHQMLTQRQVELQHCDMERRHLEQLCLLKDQTEMQLMKQKRLMEDQVSEIEHRLCERETALNEEKTRLLEELREKDERLLQMSQPQSPRSLPPPSPSRSLSMGDLRLNVSSSDAFGGVDLSSSAEEADKQHWQAIQTLREKLKLEYNIRTSRLAESQASAVASYWMRHQNKNDGDP